MSPDSAEKESHLASCDTSGRGSTEIDCCSLSSGEMVLRSNSFCLEDQSVLGVSSLDESSIFGPAGHPALPAESNLLPTPPLDVCEKSPERVADENIGHLCLGMTFTLAELSAEENDVAASSCLVSLPSENEGGLLMTFICETSPADCGKEDQFASADTQLLHFHGAITPDQGKTFVSTLSAVQDTDKDIHTSTPIQNIRNKIPSLPSLSESPCTGNADSPGLHPVKQQQISKSPKHLVAGLLPSASKVKKMEIKKFPKSDFSTVKSKVLTRNMPPVSVPGSASQHKQSQVNVNNKRTKAQTGTTFRISPARGRSNTAVVSTTPKMVSGAQVNTGGANLRVAVMQSPARPAVDGRSKRTASPLPHHLSANKYSSAIRYSNSSCETKHAASSQDAAAQHAGSQTFCLSSFEKSPDRSGQTDPTIGPNKCVSNKIEVKLGHLKYSSQNKRAIQAEATDRPAENSTREFKKISLVAESSKLTAGASWDENKSRFQRLPSLRRTRGGPLPQATTATPRPAALSTSQRQAALGTDECRTSRAVGTPQSKQKSSTGSHRAQAAGEPSLGTALTASIKPQLNVSRPPRTPSRPSLMGLARTPASRLRRKTLGPSKSLTEASVYTELSEGAVSRQALAVACKPAAFTSKGASNSTASPLKRSASVRLVRLTSSEPVSKNKTGSCQQHPQQQASQPSQSSGPPNVVPASAAEGGREDQSIQQLRGLLAASNCRFEAVAIVLQQTLAERDEATRQCRDLSQELVNLRGELVCSINSSERLQKERDELRAALEDALQKVQEQHQKDLAELEQRLQTFYQAVCDKVHLTYQEEADKCKTLMQQMGELKANHETMKLELAKSHTEQLQCVKQQYETSLEDLCKVHDQELQSLDKTLKDAEATLSEQIEVLTAENNALIEKLTAEENRRKELAEKSQKDSHTLYLEQELESLKVVLDIKNKRLHQQEKKLMEIDKLKDKNVKLDESLKKVQQENEDLKACVDKHTALSRQLSTEQAVLQESLQKESKVNKRLSMENEELLWKLTNGGHE